jgi:alpha-ribazole phosphatase
MNTLYFIRHGQSTANAGGITLDNKIIPLSDLGLIQAKKLANEQLNVLPTQPSAVYTSSYLRTQQTAAPYCKAVNIPAKIHPIFHEFTNIDPALLQGMTGDERWPFIKAYWDKADPYQREGVYAETFIEFDARVSEFMNQLHQFENNSVFFGHGLFFSLLIWKNLGFKVNNSASMTAFRHFQLALPMPNCAIYSLNCMPTQHKSRNHLLQINAILPSMPML